ncbi:MAG: DUF2933 domain-containing protein [Proteobacteria bacterium]|nr:DUF2933 domain-containing protein [Pseudomonadota bacterium]
MSDNFVPGHDDHAPSHFLISRAGIVMLGFLAIGGVLLFTEHRAHVLGILPWLFLFACPLMHVFMHGGHGGHSGHGDHHHHEERDVQAERKESGA